MYFPLNQVLSSQQEVGKSATECLCGKHSLVAIIKSQEKVANKARAPNNYV